MKSEKRSIQTVMSWLQKGVKIDTVGSKELEEHCVVIIVTNSTTPKTNVGCCKENLPMEGAFKL